MSYIVKKNEPLINVKLTDTGRRNLANGLLNFAAFSLGDSEMDYTSDSVSDLRILRPFDNNADLILPVPSEETNNIVPINQINSIPFEIKNTAKERGFFIEDDGVTTLDSDLTKFYNLTAEW
jgi:hypothetical protein